MADIAVRRADFMMVLAYATDLATGQSRDFALRSCVLAMRLAAALRLDTAERRKVYHQAILRYIGCNADTHLLASAFGDEIALRQDLAVTDLGSHSELGAVFVRAFTRIFADLPPDQLKQAVQQGLAEAIQISVPILAGHCEVAQRIGARIGLDPGDPREPRPALRTLGRARAAAGAEGSGRQAAGPAGHPGPGRDRAERGERLRGDDRGDRKAPRRRLRAGARRPLPRRRRAAPRRDRRHRRPRDDPRASSRRRTPSSMRRPARRPSSPSPT